MLKLKNLDNIGLSIIIVTYNGKSRLQKTLEHIQDQKGIDFPCEVLLIDNNSNDQTDEFVKEFWGNSKSELLLTIIHEKKQGNSHARQRGIIEANYRYILFCDDDNWLNQEYANLGFKKITSNEQIAAIGGQGIFCNDNNIELHPIIEMNQNLFGCGPQGKQDGDTTDYKGCLYSAGMFIDRSWLNKLYATGFQSILDGRIGNSLTGGEDTELTIALKLIGGRLHYYSNLTFKHQMSAGRLTSEYLMRMYFAIGYTNYTLKPYLNKSNILIRDILVTIGLIVKYWALSILQPKSELTTQKLHLSQFRGQLKAIPKSIRKSKQIIRWMESLNNNAI